MTGRLLPAARRVTALAGAVAFALLGVPPLSALAATAAAGTPVTVTVDRVTPVAPARTTAISPLTVELTLTNRTTSALTGVRVVAERGYPLTTQTSLEAALAKAPDRQANDPSIAPVTPVTASIPAGGSATVTFRTTYSTLDGHGLCVCQYAVYPLIFSAEASSADATLLGTAVTYVPSFYLPFHDEQVSWVWSLLDRPHRLNSDTVFEDDDLSEEVSSGGRLDRALAVVEQVAPTIPMTLVLDPETLDELQVMATGSYRVRSGSTTVAGAGTAAAAAWLMRLRAILSARPGDHVELTALGDPDVQSVLQHDVTWSDTLPAATAGRVSTALGGYPTASDLAWPASGRADAATLDSFAQAGRTTVLLDDSSAGSLTQSRVVQFGTSTGAVAGPLTDRRLQSSVEQALSQPGAAAAALPTLMSRLAMPVIEQPAQPHLAVLTSPRYVDPSVPDTVALINATSTSTFTVPVSLADVTSPASLPAAITKLRAADPSGGLSDGLFTAIGTVTALASTVHSMLSVPRASASDRSTAATVLQSLPLALRRLQSSAWRADGTDPSLGLAYAQQLDQYVRSFTSGVHLVPPNSRSGSYTLGSARSSLPITVQNRLGLPVGVVVHVSTVGSVPGFTAKNIGAQTIDAGSTRTVQLPTVVQRSGRIKVEVRLTAPDGRPLGDTLILTVHSTALGRIGVIITVSAGVLLALALVLRFVRGMRRRRARRSGPAPAEQRTPVST